MLTPERAATLALLLEATGDPKPGNVDRGHDHGDATLQQFVASATAVGPALASAADGAPLGAAIEDAAAASARHGGGNTHFGAILLLAPLVAGAGAREHGDGDDGGDGSEGGDDGGEPGLRAAAERAVAATTSEDAARFFAAVDRVGLALPPLDAADADLAGLDARDPATRERVRERGVTLADVMARSAAVDGVAREWSEGFPRTFRAAGRLEHHHDGADTVERAVADASLDLLAEEPDSFVAKRHGDGVAAEVRERAAAIRDDGRDRAALTALDEELLDRGVNPGTTADVVAGGLFVALRRDGGFEV